MKQQKIIVFLVLLISILVLTSCDTIPIISQFYEDEESQSEEAETTFFPLAAAETTFNAYPVDDIECSRFVAPDGDDSHPGSEEQPWRSFQSAADQAKSGDTICFRGGTY